MRRMQLIPSNGTRLYGAIVAKEVELAQKHQGTFHRSAPKEKDRAKWAHSRYDGWVNLERGMGEVVNIEIHSKQSASEWQITSAFLGFLDRHFSDVIQAINMQIVDESAGRAKAKRAAAA